MKANMPTSDSDEKAAEQRHTKLRKQKVKPSDAKRGGKLAPNWAPHKGSAASWDAAPAASWP